VSYTSGSANGALEVYLDVVGVVTAGAAGLAAALSGVNLYLSGRREFDKWIRETLVEVFVQLFDASFRCSRGCSNLLVGQPPQSERIRLRRLIVEAHAAENEALTRLRLLAPPLVVENVRTLMEAEYALAEPCFQEPLPQAAIRDRLIIPVREGRARLMGSARSALGLRVAEGTGNFDETVSWRKLRLLLEATDEEAEV
jgi:hypothetical protein